MGIKPITIGEKYRNIIPEPEKANPLPIQPKKKTNVLCRKYKINCFPQKCGKNS